MNNGCDVEWDNGSVDSGHTSLTCASSVSNHSDSTYRVPTNEEDELDVNYDMSNSDDDCSVEEMYSDIRNDFIQSQYNSNNDRDDLETDNLIHPEMSWSIAPLMGTRLQGDVRLRQSSTVIINPTSS